MSRTRRRGVNARRNGPVRMSYPYRGTFAGPYNAAAKLAIPTPNGHGAMHPDVLDMGSTWHGARYWMAFTPYNGVEDNEVPSVVGAGSLTSGGTWTVPSGFTNPITADPVGTTHMADTDLAYDAATDRLHVLYVTTDNSSTFDIRSKWTAGDGTWSTEATVLSGGASSNLTNPSVVKTASGWRMYYTRGGTTAATKLIYFRNSTTGPASGYGSETACTVTGVDSARIFQNINAVKDTDGTIVLVISDSNESTVNGRLYFARSTDGGSTFAATGPPVLEFGPSANWDAGGIYRASVVVDTSSLVVTSGDNLHLFYSGHRDGISTWGTGYAQIPAQCIRF